jgi:hypothetical protein
MNDQYRKHPPLCHYVCTNPDCRDEWWAPWSGLDLCPACQRKFEAQQKPVEERK